jgi:hypothetical protein
MRRVAARHSRGRVGDPGRVPSIVETAGELVENPRRARHLPQQERAAIRGDRAAIKAGQHGPSSDRLKPQRIRCTLRLSIVNPEKVVMSARQFVLIASAAVLASACSDIVVPPTDGGPDPLTYASALRVINASKVPVDVLVDGRLILQELGVASVLPLIPTALGTHVVGLRANGVTTTISVQSITGQLLTTIVLLGTGSSLNASVLVDTGNVIPAGKSKLRVANLAREAGTIEIWRTQPDFQTPVHIQTPFAYGATSPYLQSDPGAWEVFVTAPGGSAKLATTGAVTVPSGGRRTVVLLDSAGVMLFKVID